MTLQEKAATWMSEQFMIPDKREELKQAILARLPKEGSFELYNDYDPSGILLDAVRAIGIECRGCSFSGDDLFPCKTGCWSDGKTVQTKEGYGAPFGTL